jgi:hypothetical protein
MSPRVGSTGHGKNEPIASLSQLNDANIVLQASKGVFSQPLTVLPDSIPSELKLLNRWIMWKLVTRQNGKSTKIPFAATNPTQTASVSDPTTWTTYNNALSAYSTGRFSGIGFVLVSVDDICGIDIDNCRNRNTGHLTEIATKILKLADAYSEISPSGNGIRILLRGQLGGLRRKNPQIGVEIYDDARYLTITGHQIDGYPVAIEARQNELNAIYALIFGSIAHEQNLPSTRPVLGLENLTNLIVDIRDGKLGKKFSDLWAGNWQQSGFTSQSEADLALCNFVMPHVENDAQLCDQLFRESGLYRAKWDEPRGEKTYGQITIQKSIQAVIAQNDSKQPDRPTDQQTQSDKLLQLAINKITTFHTPENEPYARVAIKSNHEILRIRSTKFRQWLGYEFYSEYKKSPSSTAIGEVLNTLEGQALFEGDCYPVFVRYGSQNINGELRLFLDLGTPNRHAIEITARGWHITAIPPVYFYRPETMKPLPVPVTGGEVREILDVLNVPEQDFALIAGWLLGVLAPRESHPYPLLFLYGEQGSAKSTTARLLKNLIDPSTAPLRTAPRNEADLLLAAKNQLILVFDNLSTITQSQSDAFSRLATGGGLGTRKLFTNDDEFVVEAMRPVIVTSIGEIADSSDLVERAISVELPTVLGTTRKKLTNLDAQYDKIAPRVLGALLSAVSGALANYLFVELPVLPRMADFATWVAAGEASLGLHSGEFLEKYHAHGESANVGAIDANPVASLIEKWFQDRNHWRGTVQNLLEALQSFSSESNYLKTKNPRGFANDLRRAAPLLRTIGIEINPAKSRSKNGIIASIHRVDTEHTPHAPNATE